MSTMLHTVDKLVGASRVRGVPLRPTPVAVRVFFGSGRTLLPTFLGTRDTLSSFFFLHSLFIGIISSTYNYILLLVPTHFDFVRKILRHTLSTT